MGDGTYLLTFNIKYNLLPADSLDSEVELLNLLERGVEPFSEEQSQCEQLEKYLISFANGHNLTVQVTEKTPTSDGFENYAQINVCSDNESSASALITSALDNLKNHTDIEYARFNPRRDFNC